MPITLEDDIGQSFIWEQLPQRIISLVPSISCSIVELGAVFQLVGRTKFCIHPHDKITSIPVVGGTKQIHLEKTQDLQPDLVICNHEENTKEIFDTLQSLSIPVFVTDTKTLSDNDRLLNQLGIILGKEQEALYFQQVIHQEFQSVCDLFKGKKVIYLIWKDPYMSIGGDTFIHNILHQIGLNNCLAEGKRYPTIEESMIENYAPDFIFLSSEPYPFKEQHLSCFQTLFPQAKVVLVQGEYFSWYGTMMKDACSYFRELYSNL